jgi:hypothetical protein
MHNLKNNDEAPVGEQGEAGGKNNKKIYLFPV